MSVVSGDALAFLSLEGWRTGRGLSEVLAGGLSPPPLGPGGGLRSRGAGGPASRGAGRTHVTLAGPGAAGGPWSGERAGGAEAAAAAASTAAREVAAWGGTAGRPFGRPQRRRNMAEASAAGADAGSAVAAHRFFCHFCKGEVSPKLPVRAPHVPRSGAAELPRPAGGWKLGVKRPVTPPTPVSAVPAARRLRASGRGRSLLP